MVGTNTKRIYVTIENRVYTLVKQGNEFSFCDESVPTETLEEILAEDPNIQEYNYAIERGATHDAAVFVANLSNTMYLVDAPCTNDQGNFLWNFFCDIGVLLYSNSPLIKNHMYFILQDGQFKYNNNSIPMTTSEQEHTNYIHELLS